MSNQFSHLAAAAVQAEDRVVDYFLTEVGGNITLQVVQSGENNRPILETHLRRMRKQQGRPLSPTMIDQYRTEDKALWAKYVVRGWKNVVNNEGTPVSFSSAACQELFDALPYWAFDRLRSFTGDPSNFIDYESMSDDTAGN